ncbi:hypothetical protein [Bradyrhizobium shewense]|uniref:hypothetical protein n=1 Tax=Bradyrhizobium shewense TaxID=1761772 RepID=UPI000AE369F4|nr:hypothetical protein [Bradyrhizobium shewense]
MPPPRPVCASRTFRPVTGTVSPSGSVSTVGQGDGVTFTGSGRLGARSGSGTWRRSDGCGGTWSSAKQ